MNKKKIYILLAGQAHLNHRDNHNIVNGFSRADTSRSSCTHSFNDIRASAVGFASPMDTAAEWPDFLVRRMRTKDFLGPIKRPTTDIHCNWSRLIFCWCYWCFSEAHHMHLTLVRLSKKNWEIAPSHLLKDEKITSTKSEVGNISILAQRHPCDIRLACWASNSSLYQTRTNIMTFKLLK